MFDEILKAIYENRKTGVSMENDINSTNIIVSNITRQVFTSEQEKEAFKKLFSSFNPTNFVFLPSFKRVRVSFNTAQDSQMAMKTLQGAAVHGESLKIFCLKTLPVAGSSSLRPPTPTKQFLISPPASPPVGWEPIQEDKPCINFDLLAAVAELTPGQRHELHKGTGSMPSVVVDICEDNPMQKLMANRIPHTKRPDLK